MEDVEVVYGSCLDAVQGRRDQELVMTTVLHRVGARCLRSWCPQRDFCFLHPSCFGKLMKGGQIIYVGG